MIVSVDILNRYVMFDGRRRCLAPSIPPSKGSVLLDAGLNPLNVILDQLILLTADPDVSL